MSRSTIALILIALGGIGLIGCFIKGFVIGYYPNEGLPLALAALLSVALLWLGQRFWAAAKQESGSDSDRRDA